MFDNYYLVTDIDISVTYLSIVNCIARKRTNYINKDYDGVYRSTYLH